MGRKKRSNVSAGAAAGTASTAASAADAAGASSSSLKREWKRQADRVVEQLQERFWETIPTSTVLRAASTAATATTTVLPLHDFQQHVRSILEQVPKPGLREYLVQNVAHYAQQLYRVYLDTVVIDDGSSKSTSTATSTSASTSTTTAAAAAAATTSHTPLALFSRTAYVQHLAPIIASASPLAPAAAVARAASSTGSNDKDEDVLLRLCQTALLPQESPAVATKLVWQHTLASALFETSEPNETTATTATLSTLRNRLAIALFRLGATFSPDGAGVSPLHVFAAVDALSPAFCDRLLSHVARLAAVDQPTPSTTTTTSSSALVIAQRRMVLAEFIASVIELLHRNWQRASLRLTDANRLPWTLAFAHRLSHVFVAHVALLPATAPLRPFITRLTRIMRATLHLDSMREPSASGELMFFLALIDRVKATHRQQQATTTTNSTTNTIAPHHFLQPTPALQLVELAWPAVVASLSRSSSVMYRDEYVRLALVYRSITYTSALPLRPLAAYLSSSLASLATTITAPQPYVSTLTALGAMNFEKVCAADSPVTAITLRKWLDELIGAPVEAPAYVSNLIGDTKRARSDAIDTLHVDGGDADGGGDDVEQNDDDDDAEDRDEDEEEEQGGEDEDGDDDDEELRVNRAIARLTSGLSARSTSSASSSSFVDVKADHTASFDMTMEADTWVRTQVANKSTRGGTNSSVSEQVNESIEDVQMTDKQDDAKEEHAEPVDEEVEPADEEEEQQPAAAATKTTGRATRRSSTTTAAASTRTTRSRRR